MSAAFQIFTLPKSVPLSAGTIMPGAKASFFITETSTPSPVYTDPELQIAHTQPVVADAAGILPTIYLDPAITYKVTLTTAADVLYYTIDPANDQLLSQAVIGGFLYPRTALEIANSVTPTSLAYPFGNVLRYGAVGDNVADDTAAYQAAADSGALEIIIPQPSVAYRITAPITFEANRPIKLRGSGWGWTTGGSFDGGCWINFVSATSGAACFDFTGKIEGFEASGFGIKLATNSVNQRCMRFAEILQGAIDSMRFEGTSGALDTNTALEFLDPVVATGGPYSGDTTITRCTFTGMQRAIRVGGNCTTFRISHNDLLGNLPASASTIGISLAGVPASGVAVTGLRIFGNFIEGWQVGVEDDGASNDISHNYFENNTLTATMADATFPMFTMNSIISGGAPTFPSDRTKAAIFFGPRNFMVDDAYLEMGLGYRENYRAFRMGAIQTYAPTFSGNNSMTLTSVTTSSVQGSTTLIKYRVIADVMTIYFRFDGTVGGTPSTELRFTLPNGYTAVGRHTNPVRVFDNAAFVAGGFAECQNGDTFVRVSLQAVGSFTAGAVAAYGMIEVQVSG